MLAAKATGCTAYTTRRHSSAIAAARILMPDDYKARVVANFEDRASSYDQKSPTHHRLAEQLVSHADLQPSESVVDVATGTGVVALLASQAVGCNGRVLGVDISPAMLQKARAKPTPAGGCVVEWVCSDAEQLQLPAASWDAVLCCSALPFMQHIPQAVARWAQWCKPGGRVVFNTPLDHPMEIASTMLHKLLLDRWPDLPQVTPVDPHLASVTAVQQLMDMSGLQQIKVVPEVDVYEAPGLTAQLFVQRVFDQCLTLPWAPVTPLLQPHQIEDVRKPFIASLTAQLEPYETARGMGIPYTMLVASGRRCDALGA